MFQSMRGYLEIQKHCFLRNLKTKTSRPTRDTWISVRNHQIGLCNNKTSNYFLVEIKIIWINYYIIITSATLRNWTFIPLYFKIIKHLACSENSQNDSRKFPTWSLWPENIRYSSKQLRQSETITKILE